MTLKSPRVLATLLYLGGEPIPVTVTVAETGMPLEIGEPGDYALAQADFILSQAFTDWHVHTNLFDLQTLSGSAVARVVDFGGDPERLSALKMSHNLHPANVEVLFAGAFLTPYGGYPADRVWAEKNSIVFVDDGPSIERAIAKMSDHGAAFVKVAQNATAGPVFDAGQLQNIVQVAKSYGMPVIAHVEGPGQAAAVRQAGVAGLAHAPFSEILSDAEIALQAAAVVWVATLDIHGYGAVTTEFETALNNVSRFAQAGGKVVYGTDMGNGDNANGLNLREIDALRAAGLKDTEILAALTGAFFGVSPTPEMVLVPNTIDGLDFSGAQKIEVRNKNANKN